MRVLLNILWLLLAGVWMAIGYAVAGLILCITIIGIPFGWQSFKLAGYALWPFGRALVPSATRHKGLSLIGNVLWVLLAGWWLALLHLLTGILLCITIIGIPLGVASFKMAGAALVPFREGDREPGRALVGPAGLGGGSADSLSPCRATGRGTSGP